MLELHHGTANEKIIVTLNELITLTAPYYLFRFVHVVTKDVITMIVDSADDESDYPDRYNQFDVDTDVLFLDQHPGEWHYEVYEQSSAVNTDPDDATGLIESGKMILYPATDYDPDKYNESTTFKTYNG